MQVDLQKRFDGLRLEVRGAARRSIAVGVVTGKSKTAGVEEA